MRRPILPRSFAFVLSALLVPLASEPSLAHSARQAFVFVSAFDEQGSLAKAEGMTWYLLPMTKRPMGTAIAGHSLTAINEFRTRQLDERPAIQLERWCYADILSEDSYVSSSATVQRNIEQSFRNNPDHHFQLRGKFTGESELLAVVGHYQECSGDSGSFILITDPSTNPDRLVYVDTLPFISGLQYMRLVEGNITVSTCFECGDVTGLFYDPKRRRFYWEALGD